MPDTPPAAAAAAVIDMTNCFPPHSGQHSAEHRSGAAAPSAAFAVACCPGAAACRLPSAAAAVPYDKRCSCIP